MAQITITEALSEINLIKKKIQAKQSKIQGMLTQVEHLPDPWAQLGGAQIVIKQEYQSICDLQYRLQLLRTGISAVNLQNEITIGQFIKTIHNWLIWKREIYKSHEQFIRVVNSAVKSYIDQASKSPQVYKDDTGNVQLVKTKVNIEYPEWQRYEQELMEINEKLDGQLSLKNATILIEV
jgi:hypothetical protein